MSHHVNPIRANWTPHNDSSVINEEYFVEDSTLAGAYRLLQSKTVGSMFHFPCIAAALCGSEQADLDKKGTETLILPQLDRFLAFSMLDPATFVTLLSNASWVLSDNFTGPYVETLNSILRPSLGT